MTENVVRIASSQPTRPVRGCGTCRFFSQDALNMRAYDNCDALAIVANQARVFCNGNLWEAIPPPRQRMPGFWARLGAIILRRLEKRP